MCTVPRWTSIASTVTASKSVCSACQTISSTRPASWTLSAVQIIFRDVLRRDMPLPPHTVIVPDCATFPGTRAVGGGGMDFEVTYTDEQQRFRREVRAWL